MRNITSRSAALASFLLLAACAQAPTRPLAPEARNAFKSTDVVGIVEQKELNAEIIVQNSAPATAQFGLIGALVGGAIDAGINVSRMNTAETAIAPLRDSLKGYDFDAKLLQALSQSLAPVGWLGAQPGKVVKGAKGVEMDGMLRGSTAGGVLFVATAYQLSPDFSQLNVYAKVSLFPHPAGEPAKRRKGRAEQTYAIDSDLANASYYNNFTVQTPLDAKGATPELTVAAWTGDQGAPMRRALDASLRKLAWLVAADLEYAPPPAGTAVGGDPYFDNVANAQAWNKRQEVGHITSSSDEGKVIRMNDGTVKYVAVLPKAPVLPAAAPESELASAPAADPATPAAPAAAPAAPAESAPAAAPVAAPK